MLKRWPWIDMAVAHARCRISRVPPSGRSGLRGAGLIAVLCAGLLPAALPVRAASPRVAGVILGPIHPPLAALQGSADAGTLDQGRGMGLLVPDGQRVPAQPPLGGGSGSNGGSVPASVDLSANTPPIGSQGSVASCVSWVTGYYLRGWYAKRDGYYPGGGPDNNGGFSPMYLFSQLTGGQDKGTTFNANLDMMVAQGIDTRADYTQGDTAYSPLPSAAEQANALPYKIAAYTTLFVGANQGPSAQQVIENSLAGGDPVVIGLPVYDNFWNAGSTHFFISTTNMGANHGNHAVFAAKYDTNGLWVANQWGTGWGLNGWVELSWDFVNQYVWQAMTMRPGAGPGGGATATPLATNTAVPTQQPATSTPAPPAATNTAVPTQQPPTSTPLPPATDTPTADTSGSIITIASSTPLPTTVPPAAHSAAHPRVLAARAHRTGGFFKWLLRRILKAFRSKGRGHHARAVRHTRPSAVHHVGLPRRHTRSRQGPTRGRTTHRSGGISHTPRRPHA